MTRYKNENFDTLTTPRNFYCTFHTEYAYKKAIEGNTFEFLNLQDYPIRIKQATEATDILWENRHIRKKSRYMRWCIVVLIMIILSFGAFTFIFWLLKRKLLVDYSTNPPGIECDSVTLGIENPLIEEGLRQRAYKEDLQR